MVGRYSPRKDGEWPTTNNKTDTTGTGIGNDTRGGNDRVRELLFISQKIDAINSWLGRWLSWLIVVVVLVSAVNAVVRKVFDFSSNAYLELQWVLFSVIFLLCSPWTLLNNEHIRIDIINHALPLKVRGWIDLIGHVFFLLPFTLLLLYMSIP